MLRVNHHPGTSSSTQPISRLFWHVAFWQAMTFLMLLCAVWGLYHARTKGDTEMDLALIHSAYLTVCITLVGFITFAHTYVQQHSVLEGLVISCSYCSRVRLEGSQWEALENYLSRHSLARFSHGICPDCLADQHPGTPLLDDAPGTSVAV